MAATHRIEIHKSLMGEEWTNAYLMECISMTEAQTFAELLAFFERNMHRDVVRFDYALASTLTEDDRIFRHIPLNTYGIVTTTGAPWLPLYCTMRVDFGTLDSDPCRKYYRLPVLEVDQENGLFVSGAISDKNAAINTHFFTTVLGDNLFSPKGHVVVSGSVHQEVQMRQLHRRKRPVPA